VFIDRKHLITCDVQYPQFFATPVKLRLTWNVSSADADEGDSVDFEVLEDVAVNGIVVIPGPAHLRASWLRGSPVHLPRQLGLTYTVVIMAQVSDERIIILDRNALKGGRRPFERVRQLETTSYFNRPLGLPFPSTIPTGRELMGMVRGR
jgi:hypothetical protein